MPKTSPESLFQRSLQKAAPIILDGAIGMLNAIMTSYPTTLRPSGEAYLLACIDHAVAGDCESLQRLSSIQPPETEETIVLLSPSTGETLRIPASPEWVRWFQGFVVVLQWIATMPDVRTKVGKCLQCRRLFVITRMNQRVCGKTCPQKGTLKRERGVYHRAYREFRRRIENGKDVRRVLKDMGLDTRYKEVIEKYGSHWLEKT